LWNAVNDAVRPALFAIASRHHHPGGRMKRTLFAIALVVALSPVAQAQESRAAVDTQRDANQQQRIEQGLQSGQLSTLEAGRLEREQQAIDRQQARAMRTGGTLTAQEQARIRREQNAASRSIYRQKHDAQTGNPDSASSRRLQADVQRNASQQQRIADGVRSGQLTGREAGHLEGGQARIDRNEANAAANGHVGAREQAHVQARENRQSRHVYRNKHNTRRQGGN
jgi:hypothetical protein